MEGAKRELVYIAGPYRGNIRKNIRAAEEAAVELAKAGIHFVCPHLNSSFMDHDAPDSFWLDMDLNILERCDAIVMLPGWTTSSGATKERQEARRMGKTVYGSVEDMIQAARLKRVRQAYAPE